MLRRENIQLLYISPEHVHLPSSCALLERRSIDHGGQDSGQFSRQKRKTHFIHRAVSKHGRRGTHVPGTVTSMFPGRKGTYATRAVSQAEENIRNMYRSPAGRRESSNHSAGRQVENLLAEEEIKKSGKGTSHVSRSELINEAVKKVSHL